MSVLNYYTTLRKIPDERRSKILIILLLLYISVLLNEFVDR